MEAFEQKILVRWSDLDPNNHVRHSAYYDYGAQARIACLYQQGIGIDWLSRNGIGPVLFREEAVFYRELRFHDQLIIDTKLSCVSADHRKWSIRHSIMRGDELCAIITVDGAWIDLEKRRIVQPPPELIEKFEAGARTEDFQIIDSAKKQG